MGNRRRGVGGVPSILAAFLAGIIVAVVVVPNRHNRSDVSSAGALQHGAGGAGAESGSQTSGEPGVSGGQAGLGPGAGSAAQGGATGQGTGQGVGKPFSGATTLGAGSTGSAFRGVTSNTVTIGVATQNLDSLGPICPRCRSGQADQAAAALVAAWHRDGLLPVHGRDFKVITRDYDILDPSAQRSACVAFANQDKPFAVIDGTGKLAANCLAPEFKIFGFGGVANIDEDLIQADAPYYTAIPASPDRVLRNWVPWLKMMHLLDGQVLGMYSDADATFGFGQADLTRDFRNPLKQAGYKLAVDVVSPSGGNNSDAGVAVERFRAAGVTVALQLTAFGTIQFQSAAEAQGYRPKYPMVDTSALLGDDATADIMYNPDAEDGNYGLGQSSWDWSSSNPAVPKGNPPATYCINAFQTYVHRQVDVYANDAEVRIVLDMCSMMEVMRKAIDLAGPVLNGDTFLQGLYQVRNLQTSAYTSVSFASGKLGGQDQWWTIQDKKSRWQPTNDYMAGVSGWSSWWVN